MGSVVGSLTGDSTSLLTTRSPGTNKPLNLVYFSTSVFLASTTLLQFTEQSWWYTGLFGIVSSLHLMTNYES